MSKKHLTPAECAVQPVTMTRLALDALCWLSSKFGPPADWHAEKGEAIWFPHGKPDDEDDGPVDYVEIRFTGDRPEVDVMCFCDIGRMVIGYCVTEGIEFRTGDQVIEALRTENAAKGAAKAKRLN